MHPDRLPPAMAAREAEVALLGACREDPTAFAAARAALAPDAFAWPEHGALWDVLGRLNDAGEEVGDGVLVYRALERAGVSRAAAVVAHTVGAGLPASVPHYVAAVRAAARRRAVAQVAGELATAAADAAADVEAAAGRTAGALLPLAACDAAGPGGGFRPAREGLGDLMETLEVRAQAARSGELLGVPTGFAELDEIFHGWRDGEFIVAGAGPKMGKTAFSLNVLRAAVGAGFASGVVSCEMTRDELLEGLLSREARIPRRHLASGLLRDDDYPRLARAAGQLSADLGRLHIYDAAFPTLGDVVAQATKLKAAHPEIRLLVVDYLQLVGHRMTGRRGDEEIAAVCAGLKSLAKRLGVVVLAPAQTNYKDTDKRDNKRPTPADLQGGSGMAQTANAVLLLYRPAVHEPAADDVLEVEVALSRRTPRATVVLGWDGAHMRVYSRAAERAAARLTLHTQDAA